MRRICVFGLILCLLAGCCVAAAGEASVPVPDKDVIILFTSDVHCGIDENWGYAGLYAMKQSLSGDNYVLLVDDGDAFQGEPVGTMTTGEGIVDIMNVMGYDVAIPGNHDFDYGVDRFLELTEKANFPYICCNFNREGKLLFNPSLIKEVGGIKIGFVGVTTPMTLRTCTPRYFMNDAGDFIYGFLQDKTGESLYSAVQKAVDDVRAAGADYVVLIAHLGLDEESSPWKYDEVVANTTGIDVVLDGHSHDVEKGIVVKAGDGKDVIRAACGTKLNNVGALTIAADGTLSTQLFGWVSGIAAPKLLGIRNAGSEAVSRASDVLSAKLKDVVAKTEVDLVISDPDSLDEEGNPVRIIRQRETNLGDLCADAYLDQAGDADIAFVNGGGIRAGLKAGDITLNDILMIHPFGNYLTVIEVTGQQILDALEWSVHSLPGEFGGFNQVAGLTFEYDDTIPSPAVENDDNMMFDHIDDTMERRVRNVMVAGEPLDPRKLYKLASHSFELLNNGDGYTMYQGAAVVQEAVKLDNQVLIDFITETLGGVVGGRYTDPYGQGRIVPVGAEK